MLMKRRWRNPHVSGLVTILSALLLGIQIDLKFGPLWPARANNLSAFGISWTSVGIAVCGLVVIATQIRRSLEMRRYKIDRDLLEAFLEHIPVNVYFKNRESRFLRVGRAMADYFGLGDPAQVFNKTDSEIFTSEHAIQALADEREILRTGQPMPSKEEKETWPDGRESWVLTTKVPLKDERGRIIGTMGISQDITERKQAELRIRHMALHDALTGLPNRTQLEERLVQAIALARRDQKWVAVLMLDLDHFKDVNDSLGHHVGDCLLETVATRLRACTRESDIVARLGGDEFVIGLPFAGNDSEIELVAQKIMSILKEPCWIEGRAVRTSASIGISRYPLDGADPEFLLKTADSAMYAAKRKGRSIYSFAS
ncbi:MAG: GGDEF domain-containing protein [Terracidiphilus sp.]